MNRVQTIGAVLALSALSAPAFAHITPVSRFSDVSFDASGLGHPAGGPDEYAHSISTSDVFNETLSGFVISPQPNGAVNTGSWSVAQSSAVEDDSIEVSLTQSATVATDFGAPGIFTGSTFDVAFSVAETIDAQVDVLVDGDGAPGSARFARVQLMRESVTVFNTGFGQVIPYVVTLEPGFVYRLIVDVAGEAEFNATTSSSADASLTLLLPVADSDNDGVFDDTDNCIVAANPQQIDADGDGYGNMCDPDYDGNCVVNVSDLATLRQAMFSSDPLVDLDASGSVNVVDLALMRQYFFQAPGPSALTTACE